MGVSLKKIFNDEGNDLAANKSANAIKALINITLIVFAFLIVAVIIKFLPDKDAQRRKDIIQDMKFIQQTIQVHASKHNANPETVKLIGTNLADHPQVVSTDGIEEEYRYGYYLLAPEDVASMTTSLNIPNALNLPKEYYIVNYDTSDVINFAGIKYDKVLYHSMEDILLIDKEQKPPKRQVIRTAADLEKIRQNPGGAFKLSGNLDMSIYSAGEGWDPIPNFTGTIDGRGYTIENLTIKKPSIEYVGLFKQVSAGAKITSLSFSNVNVQGSGYVGVVAGSNNGDISFVKVHDGEVTGTTHYIGGLVGAHANNKISNCEVDLKYVNGSTNAGGLVGIMYSGTIAKSGATIQNITGKEVLGGAIGCVTMNDATYIQEVKAEVQNLSGAKDLGGLIGAIDTAGDKSLLLINSYARGVINGAHERGGGLIGYMKSVSDAKFELSSLYSTVNLVKKSRTTGGAVGYSDIADSAKINFCFWEKDIAPGEELNDVGSEASGTFPIHFFEPKTPNEMRIRSTYTDWDFDTWSIEERVDTPRLKWELK